MSEEVEVIEVRAANSLVPNLTISVEKDEEGEEPTVEFHEEENTASAPEEEKTEDSSVEFKVETKAFPHTKIYENKILKDMGLTAEEARLRKQNRAKRFQSPMLRDESDPVDTDQKLVENLITKVEEYNKTAEEFKEIRLDAVHLRGLDDMSTEDIFGFFGDLYPSHIEWLNDTACNVVWKDDKSAASAVFKMTKLNKARAKSVDEKPKESEETKTPDDDDELDLIDSDNEEEEMEVEEGSKDEPQNGADPELFTNELRRCKKPFVNETKKVLLKLRFANLSDKKALGGAKKSQYYRKYGNPNYGNVRGLLSRSFMKRFHGRVARQEYEGYKPGFDEEERSHEVEQKHDSAKKVASKRMYSEQAWTVAKKAKKNDDDGETSSGSESSENEDEKDDLDLINSSAKDLEDAIPAPKDRDSNYEESEDNTMMADRISKKIEAARRSQEDAAQSGNLNIKISGGSNVWSRLGRKPEQESKELAFTVKNDNLVQRKQVLEQDKDVRNRLPASLRDRLGARKY